MSRTITALFDDRADAEAAEARLKAANVGGNFTIHAKDSDTFDHDNHSTQAQPGIWGSVKNVFLPEEDRHTYEEGIRRGGYLLTADVSEEEVDHAIRVLEETSSVDMDQRAHDWRSSGWDYAPGAAVAGTGVGSALFGNTGRDTTDAHITDGEDLGSDRVFDRGTDLSNAESIPVIEEQLVVGKREVSRGGATVRSYVRETPVSEQVRLRDEQIEVDRRPVDRALTPGEDAFAERTIAMTATGEEAVVGKTARVVEEVSLHKTGEDRTETVHDTVRHTEVEVDRDSDATRGTDGKY